MRVKAYSWYDPRSSLRQHEDKTGNQMTFWQRLQGVYRIFTDHWNKSNFPVQTRVML